MARKGSITVFLALMLGLILSLLSSGIESARMAAARTQILNGLDIGLYSLFGQYDKSLLKDFDIFAFDGSSGGKELDLASVYDEVESYMKPVLGQNSQELSLEQGGVTGYQLLTDESGEVFYQQVVSYMRETLGSQGVQLLLKKLRKQKKKEKRWKTERPLKGMMLKWDGHPRKVRLCWKKRKSRSSKIRDKMASLMAVQELWSLYSHSLRQRWIILFL